MSSQIILLVGEKTTFEGDIIVHPVQHDVQHEDALHQAAGPNLYRAYQALWTDHNGIRCPIGSIRPTPAFQLQAKWIFHCVGPVWPTQGDPTNFVALAGLQMKVETSTIRESQIVARQQLRDCYKKTALMALGMDLKTIAFPHNLSAECPPETHAEIALGWAKDYLQDQNWPLKVTFYLHSQENLLTWQKVAQRLHL